MLSSTRSRVLALAAAVLLAATACSSDGDGPGESASSPAPSSPASSPAASSPGPGASSPGASSSGRRATGATVAGTVATDLDTPWGLAFLPGGDALVASRDTGEVVRVSEGGRKRTVGTVPGVRTADGGEGGLLGLAVAPTFEQDRYVYAYYTAERDNRIVRMKLEGDRLGRPATVLAGIPSGTNHIGGRIAFGPDGMLYAGTGERYDADLAQDRSSLGGKILRMRPDGEPAPGNPFPGSVVYSLGHRNVQGLAWDDQGRLWASEFGQNRWDELNLIRPGGNYGWPEVEGKADGSADRDEYVDPVAQWSTEEASPSGIAYADGAVWLAGLRGRRLWMVPVDGERAGKPKALFTGEYGRLRTVARAADGSLWLSTSNTDGRGTPGADDDRLLRLTVR
ncbi:PQQ-dependent sugar dehydrogenase [Streptomyces capparidis]